MRPYVGTFAQLLADFVATKRALGYKYQGEARHLLQFSEFTVETGVEKPILSRDIVEAWGTPRLGEALGTTRYRVSAVRQFALHLNTLGHVAYVAPSERFPPGPRFVPFIFTQDEIDRIFVHSDNLYPSRSSDMPCIMPVLIRMLYGCGLRISEAVSLLNKDVDLNAGLLRIRCSKSGKERLVPMSASLIDVCRAYSKTVHHRSSGEDYYFKKPTGQPISRNTAYRRFREIIWNAGISHGGKGIGPRLHDLRHTFAVHSLGQSVAEGKDVYVALPILSTYLGHSSVTATEQYVRLTSKHFPDITKAMEEACANVVPEMMSW